MSGARTTRGSVEDVSAEQDFMNLGRWLMENTSDKELTVLMAQLGLACKATSRACAKAGIAGLFGLAGEVNSTGDDQKKLDVLSDEIFVSALINSGACAVLVSEERDEAIIVPEEKAGRFCVAFDPLDGSSNIDCNVSTGTIFAVYEKLHPDSKERHAARDAPSETPAHTRPVSHCRYCTEAHPQHPARSSPWPARAPLQDSSEADILRTGTDIVVAGYCMYGAATELVLCFRSNDAGVERFSLDPSLGEFIHTHTAVKIPPGGGKKIYSCNEGNSCNWDAPILDAVAQFKAEGYSARYVGSMVSDVHRTILYGGIYIYPADKKSAKGKLRVLYEGFPMALIVETAGGIGSTGLFQGKVQRMLDLVPGSIHDRCPVILGSPRDVKLVLAKYEAGN